MGTGWFLYLFMTHRPCFMWLENESRTCKKWDLFWKNCYSFVRVKMLQDIFSLFIFFLGPFLGKLLQFWGSKNATRYLFSFYFFGNFTLTITEGMWSAIFLTNNFSV
jgi:hypothetical protein